jgi:tetratricopeptide (TPR) repeat protein
VCSSDLSLNNVALLVQSRGDYKNPESMFRRVIRINEKHFGKDDPRLGMDVINLAGNLQLQKRWVEAEQVTRQAIALYEQTFGNEHHMMGSVLMGLADILHQEKRYEDEETTLRKALAVHQKALGDQHSVTAANMFRLSGCLWERKKLVEAEKLLREAYMILCAQVQGQRPDEQQLGNVRDLYMLILIDLRYTRTVALDRLDMIRGGSDPGPLPGTGI